MIEKILTVLKSHAIIREDEEVASESFQRIFNSLIANGPLASQIEILENYDDNSEVSFLSFLNEFYAELVTPQDENDKLVINAFCFKVPGLPPAFSQDEILI